MKTAFPISSLLHQKASALWSVSPDTTVFDAIKLMAEKNIGALPVLSADGQLVGVFTERDYTRKVALHGKSSRETRVREITASDIGDRDNGRYRGRLHAVDDRETRAASAGG